jgi:16S rRNA (adenine1518-N6/adenine1519-N6)-dimethyltransferase
MKPVRPKRSLGQNFLVDPSVASRIVSAAAVRPGETVVEIGPGRGALTGRLRELAERLICIEKDDELAAGLQRRFADDEGAELVHADALEVSPGQLPLPGPYRVIANLPYNVAARIAMHLLEDWRPHLIEATLMFQREVADRIAAAPSTKSYGALSVLVASFAEAWPLFGVPPRSFRPVPKVQSSVVRLRPRATPLWQEAGLDYERFRTVVHAGFQARRKLIANALVIGLGCSTDEARDALNRADVSLQLRPDAIDLDGWLRLAVALS